jgi:predicted dehydrogenase
MNKPIRVGLIRCDTHGMYYGPLMEKHDPLVFDLPVPMDQPASDSWMRGGNHYYFYTKYNNPTKMTCEQVAGFELVKLWDENRHDAEIAARVFRGKPRVCDRFEEVSDDVDLVFVADCNGDGSDHLKLATPGLKKGVPTFIDKPLAFTTADAQRLLALAKNHRAPLFSCSILQALPQVKHFAARLPETGGAHSGTVIGGGITMAGQLHAIVIALTVFGNGVESVRAMGDHPLGVMHLSYGGRSGRPKHGVVLCCDVGPQFHCTFQISAYGSDCAAHAPPTINDFFFPQGAANILKMCRRMVRTGRVPGIEMNNMIEAVAIAEAARRAQKVGRAVRVVEGGRR